MIEKGYLADNLLSAAREYLEIEKRYGFFGTPIKINAGGTKLDLIALAVETGDEGDKRVTTPDGSSRMIPGRMAIILAPGYDFATSSHFTENQLSRMFAAAGLELSDYTGIEGNWANKVELQIAHAEESKNGGGSLNQDKHEPSGAQPERKVRGSEVSTPENQESGNLPEWLWVILSIAALSAIAWLVAVIFRKKRRG